MSQPMDSATIQALNRKAVQKAYADYIATYNWQWFCTLTFRDPPHPEHAFKAFKLWVNCINRQLYGPRYRKKKLSIFYTLAWEKHKSGVWHLHALLGDVEDLNNRFSRRAARNLWFQYCGISRVDPITDKLKAVSNYVSKYVAKGGEIDFCDNLNSFATQLPGWDL